MKTLTCLFCLCLLEPYANAQAGTLLQLKAVERVIDESGHPVAGALATIGYYTNSQSVTVEKITGTNGLFEFQDTSPSEYADYSFEAKKDGYYSIWQQVNLQSPYDPAKWNIDKTLVLKRIGKPIAMYAKSVNLGMPVFDKPAGFDFMTGDWVAPFGKGIDTDIIFTAHLDQRAENDADYKLTVSFPKTGDGIQEFTLPDSEKGSGLRSPHEAPTTGYQSQWVQTRSRKPGQPETGNLDANRNYIFRVRTALDHQGNVVSAHYGKIYGDFLQFRYYLNPTPNSRNIEFDPKQNLLQGLQSFEQVAAP
jgi:hypothetical protein